MKDIVVRASIKTDTFFNTGFIHITDEIIEGVFTKDYIKISIDGKRMILHLSEDIFFKDSTGYIHHKMVETIFQNKYLYSDFYIPDSYTLFDESKNVLTLSIFEKPVSGPEKTTILKMLESIRF